MSAPSGRNWGWRRPAGGAAARREWPAGAQQRCGGITGGLCLAQPHGLGQGAMVLTLDVQQLCHLDSYILYSVPSCSNGCRPTFVQVQSGNARRKGI